MTPREVFTKLSAGISSGDWSRLHELYAPDAVVEMPFALPSPVHIDGREGVRRHFALNGQAGISLRADAVRVHETADPEVVIAEFDYDGRAPSGRTFRVSNIQVLRVRDGLIVETRDYHNHAALAEVLT
ncbi:nuclear transport factor 2 family protein [Actinoplanes sp. NPDC051411]|uniref:nuclear transport factor 2 family protein n=1 Tax=Actinoplanes sp. NPDC051411 TaxID=3155522 RepID=UPI00343FF077